MGGATVAYGRFIQAVITFLITALTLFLLLKGVNRFLRRREAEETAEAKAEEAVSPVPADVQLLTEIRDLLAKERNV